MIDMVSSHFLDELEQQVNDRLESIEDTQECKKGNRMKCFHQGQVDAYNDVLDMISDMKQDGEL